MRIAHTVFMSSLLLASIVVADDVVLHSGARLQGTILKRTDQSLWLDVGPTVLKLEMNDVAEVIADNPEADLIEVVQDDLFSTAGNLRELSPREHARRLGPAVIKVSTPGGLGSGVIINEDGSAITNAHVIQGDADLSAVTWIPQPDGTLKRTTIENVEIVAVNNHLDLALLRIPHPTGGTFSFSPLEAFETIEVGQPVFAIGNPLGLEQTTSQGVISTTQRNFEGLSYIQTDTAINPGNSGGPLFNTRGEVVGITNMGITGGEALGFAIPTRYVKDFIRNREAFAYDPSNPNAGHAYNTPPVRKRQGTPPALRDD